MAAHIHFSPDALAPPRACKLKSAATWFLAAGLAGTLLVLVGNGLVSFWNVRKLTEIEGKVAHSCETRVHLKDMLAAIHTGDAVLRWRTFTSNDGTFTAFDEVLARLRLELAHLESLNVNNDEQEKRLGQLRTLLAQLFPGFEDPGAPPRGDEIQKVSSPPTQNLTNIAFQK